MKCFNVKNESIWIGFWSDLTQIFIAIANAELTFYETALLPSTLLPYISSICAGFCIQESQGLSLPTFKGLLSSSFPFSFIQGYKNTHFLLKFNVLFV